MHIRFRLTFPWQERIIGSPARIKTVMGGRGVGKTASLSRPLLVMEALKNQNSLYAYFAPSYGRAMMEYRRIAKDRHLRPLIREHHAQPYPHIIFYSGSRVNFRTCDREDNLLGDHLNGLVNDECHMNGEQIWDRVLRPQLAAKRGWALLLGQHDEGGEEGWINRRLFVPGQKAGQSRIQSWRIPSSEGFMYQGEDGKAELDYIKQTTGEIDWRRQYMAEAIEGENLVFRQSDLRAATAGEPESIIEAGRNYIGGWDLGRVVDPSAWCVLKQTGKESGIMVAEGLRPLGEMHEIGAQRCAETSRLYGNCTMVVDTTGGAFGGHTGNLDHDGIVKYYRQAVPNMRPLSINVKSKHEMVSQLHLALEQKRIQIPEGCPLTHAQLRKFRWKHINGHLSYSGPNGHEDDLVWALCMAFNGLLWGWFSSTDGMTSISSLM